MPSYAVYIIPRDKTDKREHAIVINTTFERANWTLEVIKRTLSAVGERAHFDPTIREEHPCYMFDTERVKFMDIDGAIHCKEMKLFQSDTRQKESTRVDFSDGDYSYVRHETAEIIVRLHSEWRIIATVPKEKLSLSQALKHFNSCGGSGGINWTWAYFPTELDAQGFNTWCGSNGFETRGVYNPREHTDNAWGVRYR